jgi:hypothetical protein
MQYRTPLCARDCRSMPFVFCLRSTLCIAAAAVAIDPLVLRLMLGVPRPVDEAHVNLD